MSEIFELKDIIPKSCVQNVGVQNEAQTFTFDGFLQYHEHPSNPNSRSGFLPIRIEKVVKLDLSDKGYYYEFGIESDVAKMRFGKVRKDRWDESIFKYKPLGIELAFPHGQVFRAESYYEFHAGSKFLTEQVPYWAKVNEVDVPVVTLHLRCMIETDNDSK